MPSITAEQAMMVAVTARLKGGSTAGDRVYLDHVPDGQIVRPYIVYFLVGNNRARARRAKRYGELTITVKCVAESKLSALAGSEWILDRLDYQGAQDPGGGGLDAGAEWVITTVTADRAVDLVERVDGTRRLYHCGNQFILIMEAV